MVWLDTLGVKWLEKWHGSGTTEQYQFYRCETCHGLVTWHRIRSGGCPCGGSRVRPAVLSITEKARCLLAPWTV